MGYSDQWYNYYDNADELLSRGQFRAQGKAGVQSWLTKADDPLLTSTSNYRNDTYGPEVFNWLTFNPRAWWAILDKRPAPPRDDGFRMVTGGKQGLDTAGILENGVLSDTGKPTLSVYRIPSKIVTTRWEQTLHATLNPNDEVGGDAASFLRNYKGEEHADQINRMLGRDAQSTGSATVLIESIDRVISNLSEATNIFTNATAANPWAGSSLSPVTRAGAGLGAISTSDNDCVVKHNNGSLRTLTLTLLDSLYDDVVDNGANISDLVWVTGHDTASQWARLLSGRERFVDKTRVTVGFGGVTNTGVETGFEVATYRDVPIIELQSDVIVQDTDTSTSVAGSSRIYLIDRRCIFLEVYIPTTFGEVSGMADWIQLDNLKDISMFLTAAELKASKFRTSGKIRDLAL